MAVVGDRGYDSWDIRLRAVDMAARIPSKRNAVEPLPIGPAAYRERNRVERLVNKMNQVRAVGTRHDKLGGTFLATIRVGSPSSGRGPPPAEPQDAGPHTSTK